MISYLKIHPDYKDALEEHRKQPKEIQFQYRIPIPKDTLKKIFWRSGGACESCNTALAKEMHHLTYLLPSKDGYIFGYETPDNLQHLCKECHKKEHMNGGKL